MEKEKCLSVRLTMEQYMELKNKAEGSGFVNLSEYARDLLLNNQEVYNTEDQGNEGLAQNNPTLYVEVGKELVKLQSTIESVQCKWLKEELKERVEEIWHMLN